MNNLVVNNTMDIMKYAKPKFTEIYGNSIKFEQEKTFALQIFYNNPYLEKIARKNPKSAISAIANLAAMGLSLNPARKMAYLVPRGNTICLDISYMGLLATAVSDGDCRMVKCNMIYSTDKFLINGIDKQPTHEFNPLATNRGDITGVCAIIKINDTDYYTEVMSIAEINKIKYLNEAVKKGLKSAWNDFFNEMAKKVVLKRALKFIKGKSSKTDEIIEYMNKHGEGIEFKDKEVNRIATVTEMLEDQTDASKEVVKDITSFKKILSKLGLLPEEYESFMEFHQLNEKAKDNIELINSSTKEFIEELYKMFREVDNETEDL